MKNQPMTMPFRTSDFLTAVTMMVLEHRLLGVERNNPRRVVFEFEQSAQLEKDIERLRQGEILVDPADFWAAERRCKQIIYGGERL